MKSNILSLLVLIFWVHQAIAQLKVGENPNTIDPNSIIELESPNKALVLTRLTEVEMNNLIPLRGAIVYNLDAQCVYAFDGASWKNLCGSGTTVITSPTSPVSNESGDIWFNETTGVASVWDGTSWIAISSRYHTGAGMPMASTVTNPLPGDIYVDNTTGDLFTYTGSDWISQTIQAGNGLSQNQQTIELGGTLTQATLLETDPTNTLAVVGLEEVSPTGHQIAMVEDNTGILRKASASAFVQQEESVIIANEGQKQFTTPLPISNSKKVEVYRNGVKIGFTTINSTIIELETNITCFQNDEIRIVQLL